MRTGNETYSIQTMRERNLSSGNIVYPASAISTIPELSVDRYHLMGYWKTRKSSIQNHSGHMIIDTSGEINLTQEMDQKSATRYSKDRVGVHGQMVVKIELKESKMKNVFSNSMKSTIAAIMLLSLALGQGTPKLDIRIEDQKLNMTEAEKKDASVITYIPGDTLRYVITASNIGDGLMKDPEIIDPIPAGVTYVAESAKGIDADITFSMNQGSTYMPWPLYYTVRNSKGILVKREATPEMITHIKWNISKNMNPGEASTMEFLVVVSK
ncbi:MAG: hypothetical protein K9M55_00700 [Candidatus Marinimicrobia bacterium]|nr:hypothetical protein [Candidatus Neomarinimicrobiota bacterium]MCF7921196.1 hypothetical protein [Candidatus Neomarinimicrobiota bacterium]